jgi:hypothetical protein
VTGSRQPGWRPATRRDLAARHELGLAEEPALEELVAQRAAALELLLVLDLLGQQRDAVGLEQLGLARRVALVAGARVDLDDARELQQRLGLGAVGEVVEGHDVAGVGQRPQAIDQRVVDELVLEQLEHDQLGLERQRIDLQQERRLTLT